VQGDQWYSSIIPFSCYGENPAHETACTGGVDDDCDGAIDCADTDCIFDSTKPYTAVCLQTNPCGFTGGEVPVPMPSSGICDTNAGFPGTGQYTDYCLTKYLFVSSRGPYCCYSGTITKPTCTVGAELQCLSKVDLVVNVLATQDGSVVCDSSGWVCGATSKSVQCCNEEPVSDCAGQICGDDAGFGARTKTCDLRDGSLTKHECRCGACQFNSDCASQCCEVEIKYDANGDKKIEDCVAIDTITPDKKYLCARASPVGWHECDAANFAKNINNAGKSYMCLASNGQYGWNDVSWLNSVMIAAAFAFVLMPTFGKKF